MGDVSPRVAYLKNQASKANHEAKYQRKRAERFESENVRLRELVRDMLRWMPCPHPCGRCERYHYPDGCEFELRRRELGIEVNR